MRHWVMMMSRRAQTRAKSPTNTTGTTYLTMGNKERALHGAQWTSCMEKAFVGSCVAIVAEDRSSPHYRIHAQAVLFQSYLIRGTELS
jgi:hypothetical protein